jgi:hypothetical protein
VGGNGERRQKNSDYNFKNITISFHFFANKKDNYFSTPSQEQIKGMVIITFVSSQVDR